MECPMCNCEFDETRPAILRIDNKTKICSTCGSREGVYDALFFRPKEIKNMEDYNKEKLEFLKGFAKGK